MVNKRPRISKQRQQFFSPAGRMVETNRTGARVAERESRSWVLYPGGVIPRDDLALDALEGHAEHGTDPRPDPNATNFRRDDLGTFKVTQVPSTLLRIVSFCSAPRVPIEFRS